MREFDAVIIGAGVTGCAVARWLSKKRGKFLVLDRQSDICEGTSKANSAIVHAGFDAAPGSLKAKFNVLGSNMMEALSKELDVPYKRIGALVVCTSENDLPKLEELYDRGIKNGVSGLKLLTGDEAREIEPNLSDTACGALFAETSAIICPFELCIGMAENAAVNGVEFGLGKEVTAVRHTPMGWEVETGDETYLTKTVVNAAGVFADRFHNAVSEKKISITPRKGEYMLLDKTAGGHVGHTVFQLPSKLGKGVLVSPTVHGNLLVGPTALDVEDREGTAVTSWGINELGEKSGLAVKNVPLRQVITSFAGLRAHEEGDDFIIGEAAPGFFDAAGIESPGLSSAPAIGEYVAGLVSQKLGLGENENFIKERKAVPKLKEMPTEKRAEMIRTNPAYGSIICRCEEISEGEILDAIRRPLGARTLDGVKRRTRAGMGRCQGGFCSPRVMQILSRELGEDLSEIRKNGPGSEIVVSKIRGEEIK